MLLTEAHYDTELITEDAGGQKNLYLQGITLQANVVNHNKRMYPLSVMESSVGNFQKDFVNHNRAVGELNHPTTPEVNPERIAIAINEIKQDGPNFISKSRILNTPCGNIVKGLVEGGVKIGLSTRGTGSVKANGKGINEVQEDFKLCAIDVVYYPSAPDAFVQGLMEGRDWVWDTGSPDTRLVEEIKKDIEKTSSKELVEAQVKAFRKFMKVITGK